MCKGYLCHWQDTRVRTSQHNVSYPDSVGQPSTRTSADDVSSAREPQPPFNAWWIDSSLAKTTIQQPILMTWWFKPKYGKSTPSICKPFCSVYKRLGWQKSPPKVRLLTLNVCIWNVWLAVEGLCQRKVKCKQSGMWADHKEASSNILMIDRILPLIYSQLCK